MTTYVERQHLETVNCAACGILFAFSRERISSLRDTHNNFYCPSGHTNYFPGKSEAEQLRDRLILEQAQHDQTKADLAHKEYQRRAQLAVTTKLRKRAAAGCCAFCNRSFDNLAAHVRTKHPEMTGAR